MRLQVLIANSWRGWLWRGTVLYKQPGRGAGGDVDVKLLALGSGANLARWQVTCRARA